MKAIYAKTRDDRVLKAGMAVLPFNRTVALQKLYHKLSVRAPCGLRGATRGGGALGIGSEPTCMQVASCVAPRTDMRTMIVDLTHIAPSGIRAIFKRLRCGRFENFPSCGEIDQH